MSQTLKISGVTTAEYLGFRRSHLAELTKQAYQAGLLCKVEYLRGRIIISATPLTEVENLIEHYKGLLLLKAA